MRYVEFAAGYLVGMFSGITLICALLSAAVVRSNNRKRNKA